MSNATTLKGIACYGRMTPEQNTHIVFEDEHGNLCETVLPRGFGSWKRAVSYVERRHPEIDIIEMSAV